MAASPASGVDTLTGEGLAEALAGAQVAALSVVGTARLPALAQPIVSDDVADALAEIAVEKPVNGTVEVAGPERLRLDEFVRRYPAQTETHGR